MIFNSLVSLWKKSFDFFKWKNLKLLLLATLNTFVRSLKTIARQYWWLLIIAMITRFLNIPILQDGLTLILSFLYILTIRPSIELKNQKYYLAYIKKFPAYMFITLTTVAVLFVPIKLLLSILNSPINYPGPMFYGPFTFVFIAALIYMDSINSLKSAFVALLTSFRFCISFFPIMIIIFLLEWLAVYYTIDFPIACISLHPRYFSTLAVFSIDALLFIIRHTLLILHLSALAILYVKIKHNHHKLLFN